MALRDLKTADAVGDHGGSLGRARALFPQAPEPFVDLSTGISPHSYPLLDLPATALTRLPEPSRLAELRAVAASVYGTPAVQNVVAAPGTQILLPRVASLVAPGRAMVLGPTYAEHARAAALGGHAVTEVTDVQSLMDADLAIVVNPNNPDGRLLSRPVLLDLAEVMSAKGGLLVVDEAFMDVVEPGESLAGDAGLPGLVVLRSFGKFYGLAGVRLGFALCEKRLAARLEAEFGPWAVSGPALEYGIAALSDQPWREAMRVRLAGEAQRLDDRFARYGIRATGGTSLFRYFDTPLATELFVALGRQGVLLRNFVWSANVLRCGLPGSAEEWERLEASLALWDSRQRAGEEAQ